MRDNVTGRDTFLIWKALAFVVSASKAGEPVEIDLNGQDRQDMERLLNATGNQDCKWALVLDEDDPGHPDFIPKVGLVGD